MHSAKRPKLTELNPFLICVLCNGYIVDATTINECLHSFCKSCIVTYLQRNKYCPICDVQIHKTFPLQNIRSDKTLQNIIYKIVPSLYQNEMERRSDYYSSQNKDQLPNDPEQKGQISVSNEIILQNEPISICLEYKAPVDMISQTCSRRYLVCPAGLTVNHLYKLLRGKYALGPVSHRIQIYCGEDLLPENLSLMDLAYIYKWRRKGHIHLMYKILEYKVKMVDSAENNTNVKNEEEKKVEMMKTTKVEIENKLKVEKEWKEVQLQISENGIMSIRDISNCEGSPLAGNEAPQLSSFDKTTVSNSLITTMSKVPDISTNSIITPVSSSRDNGSNLLSILPPSDQPIKLTKELSVSKVSKDEVTNQQNVKKPIDNKLSISRVPNKGDVLNKIVNKLSPNERIIGNTSVTIRAVTKDEKTTTTKSLPVTTSTLLNNVDAESAGPLTVAKSYNSVTVFRESQPQNSITLAKEDAMQSLPPVYSPKQNSLTIIREPLTNEQSPKHTVDYNKRVSSHPYKYKTLQIPTKPWNPTLDRSTILQMRKQHDNKDSNKVPPKFFKMRNRPKYLTNPTLDVKPVFSPGKVIEAEAEKKNLAEKDKLNLTTQLSSTQTSSLSRSPTKMPPPFTPGKRSSSPFTVPTLSFIPRVPPTPAHTLPPPPPPPPYSMYGYNPYSLDSARNLYQSTFSRDMLRNMTAFHSSLNMLFPSHLHPQVQAIPPTTKPDTAPSLLDFAKQSLDRIPMSKPVATTSFDSFPKLHMPYLKPPIPVLPKPPSLPPHPLDNLTSSKPVLQTCISIPKISSPKHRTELNTTLLSTQSSTTTTISKQISFLPLNQVLQSASTNVKISTEKPVSLLQHSPKLPQSPNLPHSPNLPLSPKLPHSPKLPESPEIPKNGISSSPEKTMTPNSDEPNSTTNPESSTSSAEKGNSHIDIIKNGDSSPSKSIDSPAVVIPLINNSNNSNISSEKISVNNNNDVSEKDNSILKNDITVDCSSNGDSAGSDKTNIKNCSQNNSNENDSVNNNPKVCGLEVRTEKQEITLNNNVAKELNQIKEDGLTTT